ncbi:MAG: hypothetical protein WCO11_09770 [Sphingomonadales bacterium]
MDVTIPHSVSYDFDGRASVSEVAKVLLAQDRLVREALLVLEELFPNLTFEGTSVAVRSVTQDSPLRTNLEALVVAAYATELGQDVPDILNTLFGVDVPDRYDSIVSVLVLLIAIWGIDWVRVKLFPGKKEPALLTERERLLIAAASRAAVSRDHMEEAVENTLGKHKRSIMKAAAELLAPAKRHNARAVNSGTTSISEQAIAAIPSDVELAQYEPPTITEEAEGVIVQFRAHDLDKNKAWAATIEAIAPERKPLHLAPDIKPEPLFSQTQVKADVLVTSIRDAEGEYVPSLYYLQRVYDDAT